ncbi:MAG: DUF4340 domain-containing protein [Candidatus Sumerlaeia bacterium]|nr:DUF4340 domain-containing protein [Candidatus Sumerlaeia bacterium]
MKPWRAAIAALAAVILLSVYLWDLRRTETSAILAMQQDRVLFMVPGLVSEVAFHGDEGPVHVVRVDESDKWQMTSPSEIAANEIIIESYLENLRGARRHALVDHRTAEEVGLDNPRRTVSVTFADERTGEVRTRTLEFGSQPDELSKVYAWIREEGTIFTVSDWLYRQANKSFQDLRSTVAVPADITSATRLDIYLRRNSYTLSRPDSSSMEWMLTEEDRDPIPADRGMMDRLMANLGNARFFRIHDDVTTPTAQLGLAPPTLEIVADDETALSIGNRIGELEQFIAKSADGTIGDLPGSHVIDLFRSPAEWGTKRFSWIPRSEITEIHSVLGNTRFTLKRGDDGWFFREMPGVPVRQEAVTQFLEGVESFRGSQLLSATVAEEDRLRHGLHDESYKIRLVDGDGNEHGFHFGRIDTREAMTHVYRIQDGTLWSVPSRTQGLVYRYRSDFEERRVLPGLASRADHIEIITPHGKMSFQRTPAAWRVTMPGERPTLVPPSMMLDFLDAFEDMEIQAEMIANDQIPPEITFHFYEQDMDEPFLTAGVLMRSQSTGNTILRVKSDGEPVRAVEINAEQVGFMDDSLTKLLVGAKARAEQDRQ